MHFLVDDYYDHCVLPKPNIPKSYPGYEGNRKKRQAARLQSYKDETCDNEEDEDEDMGDEFNSSIQDANINQIVFEANEFDQMYENIDDSMATTNDRTPSPPSIEKVGSAQWRIQPRNMNRPIGSAPLVPSDAPRGQLLSRTGPRMQQQQQQQGCNNRGNNNNSRCNNGRIPIQNRLGHRNMQRGQMEQRVRTAFNAFNNNPQHNNNNNNQQQVLMNMNNHFQNVARQMQIRGSQNFGPQNSMESNQVNRFIMNEARSEAVSNNWNCSHSITSLINTANQIGNNNTAFSRLGRPLYNCSNQLPCSSVNQSMYSERNQNLQLQPIQSDSIRLADLMNMDKSSFQNLDVQEVAKNAMLLLSSVFHKPVLNGVVQQELSQLQVSLLYQSNNMQSTL